jgi:hypothetical protein
MQQRSRMARRVDCWTSVVRSQTGEQQTWRILGTSYSRWPTRAGTTQAKGFKLFDSHGSLRPPPRQKRRAERKAPANQPVVASTVTRLDLRLTASRTRALSLFVKDPGRLTAAGGSECGARGQWLVTVAPGRLGHQPAGIMTGMRGARCNRGRRRRETPATFDAALREAWSEAALRDA